MKRSTRRPASVATTEAALLALACAWALASPAQAQGLRAPGNAASTLAAPAAPAGVRAADHIVAVVNSEPVTASEVRRRVDGLIQRLSRQGGDRPSAAEIEREALDQLIAERTQLQRAREIGLKVDDTTLNQAELSVAEQNQLTLEQLRQRLREQGTTPEQFRDQLRQDILLQRVREREVESPLRVTDRDLDDYLLERRSQAVATPAEVNLGHILVRVPEGASPQVVAERLSRALRASEQVKAAGSNFAAIAREFSDAPEASTGGEMGLRAQDRYPALFIESTQALKVGEVAGPVRSGAGFHILKVIERKQASAVDTVTQTRARHILLRTGPQQTQQDVIAKARELRRQAAAPGGDFAALARANSVDGSAREGGDLGWALPGMFVPEFENAMNALQPGEISQPVPSRFGVHLIQVVERRQTKPTLTEQRNMVRAEVREKKLDEAYLVWARELRDRAYVEMRQPRQ